MEKKRSIVNFNGLAPEILRAMAEQYPYGINEDDIMRLPKAKNEYLYVVRVQTLEAEYLVKVNRDLNIDFTAEDYLNRASVQVTEAAISDADKADLQSES